MDLAVTREIAELPANAATFLGIPIAIVAYVRERQRDRAQREIETFTRITDGYVDYLKLCLDKPEFSYYAHGEVGGRRLSDEEGKAYLRCEILICNLESAYYLYKNQSHVFKQRQWDAWNRYIRDWCQLPWFQAHWTPEFATYFDAEFSAHVSSIVQSARSAAPPKSPANKPLQPTSGGQVGVE